MNYMKPDDLSNAFFPEDSHHLIEENIAATIQFLKQVESGSSDKFEEWQNLDARVFAGILARQMQYLKRRNIN